MSHKVTPPAQSSAQVTAAIARDAPQFSDIIEPVIRRREAGSVTTAAAADLTVYLWRFRVAEAITVANASVFVAGTKAGHIDIGIYTLSGSTWNLAAHTGDYDIGTSGTINVVNTIPFLAAYPLVPGTDYWVAFGGTGHTTLTILRGPSGPAAVAALFTNDSILKASVYSSGLPSQITSPSGNTVPFWIGLTT